MNKNIISDFIKMKGIQTETKIKSWSAVDIDFMNDNKVTEETSFDVKNVKSPKAWAELDESFVDLCRASGIKNPVITSVTVTHSAKTQEELESISLQTLFEKGNWRNIMTFQLSRPDIDTIISYCHDMEEDDNLEVYQFGKNNDLVLHIYKDEEYDASKDADYADIVRISTAQGGRWVDDTEDVYVTDGSLYRQLQRISEYKDFSTLQEKLK